METPDKNPETNAFRGDSLPCNLRWKQLENYQRDTVYMRMWHVVVSKIIIYPENACEWSHEKAQLNHPPVRDGWFYRSDVSICSNLLEHIHHPLHRTSKQKRSSGPLEIEMHKYWGYWGACGVLFILIRCSRSMSFDACRPCCQHCHHKTCLARHSKMALAARFVCWPSVLLYPWGPVGQWTQHLCSHHCWHRRRSTFASRQWQRLQRQRPGFPRMEAKVTCAGKLWAVIHWPRDSSLSGNTKDDAMCRWAQQPLY